MVQFQQLESKCFQSGPVNIRGFIIESRNCENLLGIYIGSNFSLEYHINRICRKASQKLHAYCKRHFQKYAIQFFQNFTIQLLYSSLNV